MTTEKKHEKSSKVVLYKGFSMKTKLLIEQHFHGCFGIDFNKASVDDILFLSKEILKYGIGGIFPTIVTDSTENTKNAITRIKEALVVMLCIIKIVEHKLITIPNIQKKHIIESVT